MVKETKLMPCYILSPEQKPIFLQELKFWINRWAKKNIKVLKHGAIEELVNIPVGMDKNESLH